MNGVTARKGLCIYCNSRARGEYPKAAALSLTGFIFQGLIPRSFAA